MKNFDDFMAEMESKNFSSVLDSIAMHASNSKNISEAVIKSSLLFTTTILREYHDWLNA